MKLNDDQIEDANKHGFRFGKLSAHTARTIMLEEISTVLNYLEEPDTSKEEYRKAIIEENCLSKPSLATRKITARRLEYLYSLDPEKTVNGNIIQSYLSLDNISYR